MEKKLSEITRNEWIRYQWFDSTQQGDEERMFTKGLLRSPDEAYQAMETWDVTIEERESEE